MSLFNGVIHFTDDLFDTCLRSPRFSSSYMEYSPVLEFVSAEKDLGLYITDDLTWSKHVGDQYAKANKLLGFIRRNTRIVKSTLVRRSAYLALGDHTSVTQHKFGTHSLLNLYAKWSGFSGVPQNSS